MSAGELTTAAFASDVVGILFNEHMRQRNLCVFLKQIADLVRIDRGHVQNLLHFLAAESAQHRRFDEACLYPMIRRRAPAGERVEKMLETLLRDHDTLHAMSVRLSDDLERMLDQGETALSADVKLSLIVYADRLMRHILAEDVVLMPIAKGRLDASDRDALVACLVREEPGGSVEAG